MDRPEPGAVALRERLLPGQPFHNFVVLLGWAGRLPWPLWVVLWLALASATAALFHRWGVAAAILGGATLADGLLLWALPRLRRSYGPVAGPLLLFSVGRHLLSLPLALAPAPVDLWLLAGLQGLLGWLSLWGHLVAPFRLRVERVTLPILRGEGAGPVRIVFLSDLHLERWTAREDRALALVTALEPDLVLFGGDVLNLSYVDDPRAQRDAVAFLSALREKWPLEAVLGNPSVEDRTVVPRLWQQVGHTPLDGVARHRVRGVELAVFGLPTTSDVDRDAQRLAHRVAETSLPPEATRLLLYHRPDLAGRTRGLDVYLCGHTHGGQVRVPGLGALVTASAVERRLAAGTHRVATPGCTPGAASASRGSAPRESASGAPRS